MKWIVRIVILLFLIAFLLAIFAPSILSTQFGKHAFFRILKELSGYEARAKEMKVQWLGAQSIHQVEVVDGRGRPVFRADSINSTAPLWKLLFYHDVGHLQIQAPFIQVDPPQALASKLVISEASLMPIVAIAWTPTYKILGEVSISQGGAAFIAPGLDTVTIKDLEVEATFLPKQLKLQASGAADEKSNQGTFQVNLLAYPGSDQIDADLKFARFPLRAADQLISILEPKMKGVLRETIGDSLNGELRLKNLQDTLEIYLKANSDYFSANLETKLQGNTLELASPAVIQLQIPSKTFERVLDLPVEKSVAMQIKIDELSIPLENRAEFKFQGTLKSDALQFSQWAVDPFSLYLGSSPSEKDGWIVKVESPQVQFQGSLHLPERWENLSFAGEALLPQNTKLDLSVQTLRSIAIAFQGDLWKGRFKGTVDPTKKTVALTDPGYLSVRLSKLPYSLPSIPVEVTIQPAVVDLGALSGSIKGTVDIPPFLLGTAQVGASATKWSADIKSRTVQFSFLSTVNEGPLTADGTYVYPHDIKVKGSCNQLPVASLQPFFKEAPPLLPFIGEFITTNFQATLSENSRFVQLSTSSPNISLKASVKESGRRIELIEPAQFVWTLTPQGYEALSAWLKQPTAYTLSDPAIFKGGITTFSFTYDQPLDSLEYQGKVSADTLSLVSGQRVSKISELQLNLKHPLASSPHEFQLSAKAAPQGLLSCKGNWSSQGSADIKLQLEQFPSALFDFFASPFSNMSLSTLCGPMLNLSLSTALTQWSGPVQFELHSSNLRSSLKGALKQGTLTLADTFHLQLDINERLSQMLFKQRGSSDITSIRSTSPVTLEIAPVGFSYQLFPANLSKLQLKSGKLELGKLMCQNEGNLQTALGLLKLGQYRIGDELELWFAPMDFQIKNGILNAERTELLIANDFQVCLWGDVNFPDNSVDGVLGLTSNCLKKAFGIKNLPENYVLQIPLYGTLSDVQIDKGKATTKIGALILWQQKDVLGGSVKGPAGKFLGETLNQLGPLPGGDQKAPPPKKPFPWDTDTGGKKESAKMKKKKTSHVRGEKKTLIQPNDSALKQALQLLR